MNDLRETIRHEAIRLGFQEVGMASANAFLPHAGFLQQWIGHQYHGAMSYLEKNTEQRQDIRNWYAQAQTIVVVAHNYYTACDHKSAPGYGKIARYAWGRDYHKVIGNKLRQLLLGLQRVDAGVAGKWCVDSAPVLEKSWAAAAGIGWQGKHSNLISPRHGSWLFLGLLAINRELPVDQPLPDRCGRCTACMDACPTGAIVAPYVVDARRCLSYLTIELRDAPLPPHLLSTTGGWIFGCDICQNVCPWNRKFASPTNEPDYQPRPGLAQPLLSDLLSLDEAAFLARFAGTPVMRAKWRNFRRNVKSAIE